MGLYDPLTRYLETYEGDRWNASFKQIESILGFPLPPSASSYQAWWANETNPRQSQKKSWQDIGWMTSDLNLAGRSVVFTRSTKPGPRNRQFAAPSKPLDSLFDRAAALLNTDDREELTRKALERLLEQASRLELAALAGTMPDLAVPPRERPVA